MYTYMYTYMLGPPMILWLISIFHARDIWMTEGMKASQGFPRSVVLHPITLYGYGSIPIDTFLVGWTSIYQLFWGSLGTRVLTHSHIDYSRFMYHKPDSMPNLIPTVLIPDGWKGFFFSFRGLLRWATSQATELGFQPIQNVPKNFFAGLFASILSVFWWITIHDWFLLKKRSSRQNH